MTSIATPPLAVKPAERWGVAISAALLLATSLFDLPPWVATLPVDLVVQVGALVILVATTVRAAWQAWRAGDLAGAVDRIEAVVTDPRVAVVLQSAVAKAADRVAAAKGAPDFSSRPVSLLSVRPPPRPEDSTVREPIVPPEAGG